MSRPHSETVHVPVAGRRDAEPPVATGRWRPALAAALAVLVAAACGEDAPPPPPPTPVRVMAVEAKDTTLFEEYVGEVRGSQEVQLRARVSGVLIGKSFVDGALVKEGDLLFTIDPREMLADQAGARAQLAEARADLANAQQDVDRYEPLVRENAIARQIYDNAVSRTAAAKARVEASEALVTQANLGVEYAEVTAPLTGRIGAAQVFEGDLISAGMTLLAELSTDDPAWVYFSISETKLLELGKRYGEAGVQSDDPIRSVTLIFGDGAAYPEQGTIDFADRALDARTGTYRLRASFPNPRHQLTPGMFARIRVNSDLRKMAMVVPDRAVVQQLGKYFVMVVGADNKIEQRGVTPGPRQGALWLLEDGVKPGEIIVVEGVQKVRSGSMVEPETVTMEQMLNPTPAEAPAPAAKPE